MDGVLRELSWRGRPWHRQRPNLIRSLIVLHDRNGTESGPFLKKGSPDPERPIRNTEFTDTQIGELAQFLRQRVNDSFRGSPIFEPRNVLTGDPKAGESYFNGAGKCASCHSPTGDLAGVGKKYDAAIELQQRMVFPRPAQGRGGAAAGTSKATTTVTVTPKSGTAVSGVLVELNDFTVTLRDSSGVIRTFERTPGVTVQKNDPLAGASRNARYR